MSNFHKKQHDDCIFVKLRYDDIKDSMEEGWIGRCIGINSSEMLIRDED